MPITETVRLRLIEACKAARNSQEGAHSFPDHNHFWFRVRHGRVEVYLQCWLEHTLDDWRQLCQSFAKEGQVEVTQWGQGRKAPLLVFTPAK